MNSFTASELRRNVAEVLEEAERDVVVITRHNKPTAAVMSWEAYQGLLDTFDALVRPEMNERVRQGISEFYRGETKPWEEIRRERGFPE